MSLIYPSLEHVYYRFGSRFTIHLCNTIYFSSTFSTPCKWFTKILHFAFLDLNRALVSYPKENRYAWIKVHEQKVELLRSETSEESPILCQHQHNVTSLNGDPIICSPTGSPAAPPSTNPQGTTNAGSPAKLTFTYISCDFKPFRFLFSTIIMLQIEDNFLSSGTLEEIPKYVQVNINKRKESIEYRHDISRVHC